MDVPGRVARIVGLLVLAVVQVGGTFGAGERQPAATEPDALAAILALTGPLALLAVGRRPRSVLGVITTATTLYVSLGYPFGPVFASFVVAVVVTVARGHRALAWSALVVALAVALAARPLVLGLGWSFEQVAGVVAWGLVVGGLGELVRLSRSRTREARRARAEESRREAGEERLRIARELHDVVAHHMSLINVQAGVALHLLDKRPEQVETSLRTIKDASKEAMTELRSLVGVLRAEGEAAPLAPVATLAALDDLAARTSQAGVTTTVHVEGELDRVPGAVGAAVFRIAQEGLTNVVRHSGATRARIDVEVGPDALSLLVGDDGHGPRGAPSGAGLRGMTERAESLGGTVALADRPAGGAELRAHLPLAAR